MNRTPADGRRWAAQGTDLVRRALRSLAPDDATLAEPSALQGWSRKHLVAHVAANAEALRNLATWARTGVETPMYTSPEQRNADIEAGAQRSAADLVAWLDASAAALASDWDAFDDATWSAEVRTARGRTLPASETPWLRAREVMVHAVDLGGDVTFADLPADFLGALVDDIVAKRGGSGPALHVAPTDADQRWELAGDGDPVTVRGPLAQIAAYLAGRDHAGLTTDGGGVPELGPWL
ncbi:maleylpyruvate isomerase family mycothiol-dependent enzyme [Propioniciclava soli]|uniref:maleylpyruvate isomerase family mycothiol-dependent enzyme n=1 Tax=Propioniciclava soli TaxID=2775081 RepID=UPI001E4E0614|nr:maleylpyruvate isomerase family mycothiol-dependent enzyme [Propioniciclava soli]